MEDEALEKRVEQEFLEEASDIMNTLEVSLENIISGASPMMDGLAVLRKNVQTLGAQAHSADFGATSLVAHRLDDYLSRLKDISGQNGAEIRFFYDKLQAGLEGRLSIRSPEAGAELVRELPATSKFDADFGDIEKHNVEILVAVPDKVMGTIIEKELAGCGYRSSFARSSFKAFELGVQTRPDMVLAASVLDSLSGIDLACAYASMPATRDIPFALLTSYNWGHPSLKGLPPSAALIRKGKDFGDDLAESFKRFGIT